MSDFKVTLGDRIARQLYGDLEEVFNAITHLMVTECITSPGQYISDNADTNLRRAVVNYVIYGLFHMSLSQKDDYVLRIPYLTLDEMGSTGKKTITHLTPRARAAVKTYDIDLSGCATFEQACGHIVGLYHESLKRQEQAEELEQMRREHEVSKITVAQAATEAAATTPAAAQADAPEVATQAITEQELDNLEEIPDAEFEQEQEEKAEEVEQEEELAQDEMEGDAHKQMPLVVDQEEGTEEQAEEEDDAPFDNSDIVIEQEDGGREEPESAEDAAMKALEAILGKKNQ